ncbi:hypothetical protein BKI52_02480 [marine bacterium AO1-C]|nr:hypothetical protein BKI52_02480 [marine bacterium AO1-C]
MQETAFTNNFLNAFIDKDSSLLTIVWLPSTYEMSGEHFQSIFMKIAEFIEENKIKYWMGYTKDFAFIVPPDLQEWAAQDFNRRVLQAGLKRMAMIVPSDIIANVGVKQSIEEMERHQNIETIETRYFDDDQQAKEWLLAA